MIVFDLTCICGGQFEGWFRDHEDYQAQQKAGLVACPACGSDEVRKILSPVAIARRSQDQPPASPPSETGEDHVARAAVLFVRAVQDYVVKNYENVGCNLASEALKMHYGVAESRNIRGVATSKEKELLEKEGIALLSIPLPAEKDAEGD